ncbi:MAG: WecB/TagA/CpsF family glycosyltransferase, partial [Candidatus Gastranaerophilales bacterium]|nr:WecB/TagA/CpsF family glycosyltransferase [Candidatus Gastranaerophilales bacterium]
MNERKRACLFGLPIDITTLNDAKEFLLNSEKPMQVVTINPEMLTNSYKDNELSELIKSADLVTPDGIGVVIGLKMIGIKTQRLPGIELAYSLLKEANEKGLKVALVGADEDTIQKAKSELLKDLPNLNFVYIHNGYFNNDEEQEI